MKLNINRLGINGEGIAKIESGDYKDKLCFVDFALPNENVDVEIIKDKKKYLVGKLKNINSYSDIRTNPPCVYFGICGGCDIQHLNKNVQIDFKQKKVKDTLKNVAQLDLDIENTVRLNDFEYRNKMVFPIVYQDSQTKIGMFERESHNIVEIESCLLTNKNINLILNLTKKYFSKTNLKGFNYKTNSGDLKYLVVRNFKEEFLVTIVSTKKLDLKNYFELLKSHFENIGLSLIISDSSSEILSGKYIQLFGLEKLNIEEYGIKYQLDNRGFFQVNNEIKRKIYDMVLDNINEDDCVVDAYSGAGLLTAIIAKKCRQAIGIEINKSASDSAKELLRINNLNNVKFINGDVGTRIEKVLSENKDSVVVLDPPRAGCGNSVLNALISQKSLPKKILYISCNPATFARDLKILSEKFSIKSIVPLDMFPQSKHVECLGILERIN